MPAIIAAYAEGLTGVIKHFGTAPAGYGVAKSSVIIFAPGFASVIWPAVSVEVRDTVSPAISSLTVGGVPFTEVICPPTVRLSVETRLVKVPLPPVIVAVPSVRVVALTLVPR